MHEWGRDASARRHSCDNLSAIFAFDYEFMRSKPDGVHRRPRRRVDQNSHERQGTGVSPYNGLAIHQWVLNRYENLPLYSSFSSSYKSVDLICSARKRSVLIVQPLQFHDSPDDRSTGQPARSRRRESLVVAAAFKIVRLSPDNDLRPNVQTSNLRDLSPIIAPLFPQNHSHSWTAACNPSTNFSFWGSKFISLMSG